MRDTRFGGGVALINVDTIYRATEGSYSRSSVLGSSADGVVENEYPRGSSSVVNVLATVTAPSRRVRLTHP